MSDPLSVNLEHGERWWYAHVAELPGCFTRGETKAEVLEALNGAIMRHLRLLGDHGIRLNLPSIGFIVIEEIAGVPELGEAGGAVALFASDTKPVEAHELYACLTCMGWNREELLHMVEPLTEEARNANPIPDKWSIDRTLRHIANAEEWYISRFGTEAERMYRERMGGVLRRKKSPPLERLGLIRGCTVHTLEAIFPKKRSGTFRRAAYTRHRDEQWTFRKVLRRFIEHEREHIGTISLLINNLGDQET